MSDKAFQCPVCEHKIEKRYAYFMNNFMTIKCSKCQSKLVPDIRSCMKLGSIGGLIGSLIGFGIPTLGIIYGHVWAGFIATVVIGAVFYVITCSVAYKLMTFEKKK